MFPHSLTALYNAGPRWAKAILPPRPSAAGTGGEQPCHVLCGVRAANETRPSPCHDLAVGAVVCLQLRRRSCPGRTALQLAHRRYKVGRHSGRHSRAQLQAPRASGGKLNLRCTFRVRSVFSTTPLRARVCVCGHGFERKQCFAECSRKV